MFACESHGGNNVVVAARLHDDLGIARWHAAIPHFSASGFFVSGIAAPDDGAPEVPLNHVRKSHD
jgi:hypothetical protein